MSKRDLMLACATALLTACASTPSYHEPELAMPTQWRADEHWREAKPADNTLRGDWWTLFGDTTLNQLETQALQDNQTLKAAYANMQIARAQLDQARGGLFPQVGLSASGNRDRDSANRPWSTYYTPNASVVQNDFVVGAQVSYEADFFGRVRATVEAARANSQSATAELENTRLLLAAQLASTYFSIRELDVEIHVVTQSIDIQQKAMDVIQTRHEGGNASGLDVAQQSTLLASTRSQLKLLMNQREALQHAIATLCGQAAPTFQLAPGTLSTSLPGVLTGVPSDVLQRRPDIAAAERSVAAANAQIGIARAAFYPDIMLTSGIGHESHMLSSLPNAASYLWAFGSSAAVNLFDGGRLRAQERAAHAGYDASVANYRQTVLTAMQEVEDGLTGLDNLAAAAHDAEAAVKSADWTLNLATSRYEGGLASSLDVITAEQTLLNNQRIAAQIAGQRWQATVFLVKALGGGWRRDSAQG